MNFANKYLIPYLQISKNCGINTEGDCYFPYRNKNERDTYRNFTDTRARFYLNDGTLVGVLVNANAGVIAIYFDINGQQNPNMFGKDLFEYWYYINNPDTTELNGKLLPGYNHLTREDHITGEMSGACKNKGWGCADLIMKDGWQMKDDYPW